MHLTLLNYARSQDRIRVLQSAEMDFRRKIMSSIKNLISALCSVVLAGVVGLSSPVIASTPDGETPANEGVCDSLNGATPGLYGLCVAYCEAQDLDILATRSRRTLKSWETTTRRSRSAIRICHACRRLSLLDCAVILTRFLQLPESRPARLWATSLRSKMRFMRSMASHSVHELTRIACSVAIWTGQVPVHQYPGHLEALLSKKLLPVRPRYVTACSGL